MGQREEKGTGARRDSSGAASPKSLRSIQKAHIIHALTTTHSDVEAAAQALGLRPKELRRLMTELDIAVAEVCSESEQSPESRR